MPRSRSSTAVALGPSVRARVLAAVGLGALLGGMAIVVLDARDSGPADSAPPAATTPASTTPAAAAKPKPVVLVALPVKGVGAYDPEGDRSENDGQAPLATDGDPRTAWQTEHYRSTFGKSGVGLVLDAGRPVQARRLVLTTDTPGYSALVQVGNAPDGPFVPISGKKTTATRTVFALKPRRARYLLVWVTSMPPGGVAHVNEVRVSGRR